MLLLVDPVSSQGQVFNGFNGFNVPNSSVYGWGETAPGVRAGSEDSLPQFIELAAGLSSNGNGGSNNTTDTDNILNFISFMKSKNQWDQMRGHFLSYLDDNPDQSDVQAADSFFRDLLEEKKYLKKTVCEYRKQISSPPSGFTCRD